MDYVCDSSSRMTANVWSLLLLLQLPIIFSSGLLIPSKACRSYHISYSSDSSDELFYISGKLVNKDLFCKALNLFNENQCFNTRNVRDEYCGSNSLDELPLEAGRKFLREVLREESTEHNFAEKSEASKENIAHKSLLTPTRLAMAVPGIFVLCSSLLCCCRIKRKETAHSVLANDPVSTDSVASLKKNSVEKIPPSPKRVPPSPKRVPPSPSRFSMSPKLTRIGSVHLSMSQVARATHNFSPSLRLGEGGFGTVYKAQLQDGKLVAIKRAKKEHFEALRTEFRSEVELLAKIEHRNLVKLLGFVDKEYERLIITEYVPNGSLREHLDGLRGKILDFNQRLEISIDIAHGLTYLHLYTEKPIIHRDVKSSNILLTERMRAKVADFGFARLGDPDNDKTLISTKVKGTVGYLDPEYMRTYKLTPKSDVYSFGVLLLEILTGRRPVEVNRRADERVTLTWAFKKYDEGNAMEAVDPLMREPLNREVVLKMFGLAFRCAAPTRADRPDMKAVGEKLWGIRMECLRTTKGESDK